MVRETHSSHFPESRRLIISVDSLSMTWFQLIIAKQVLGILANLCQIVPHLVNSQPSNMLLKGRCGWTLLSLWQSLGYFLNGLKLVWSTTWETTCPIFGGCEYSSHVLRACLGFRVTVSYCQRLEDEFLFLGLLAASRGVLAPQWGITPAPPTPEAQSLKHWTTRNVLRMNFLKHPFSARRAPRKLCSHLELNFLPPWSLTHSWREVVGIKCCWAKALGNFVMCLRCSARSLHLLCFYLPVSAPLRLIL